MAKSAAARVCSPLAPAGDWRYHDTMSAVLNWDGVQLPEELRALPKGRYVLVSVDDAPELTPAQEAGLQAATVSLRAGRGVSSEDARKRIDAVLGR